MNILLKSATIIAPNCSDYHETVVDVWLQNGHIKAIEKTIDNTKTNGAQVINGSKQVLTIGFFDLNANFGEPGYETKEDLSSGSMAAAAGGFTAVATTPATLPVTQSKSIVEFIRHQSKLVELFPIGALTQNLEGKELSELFDMQQAGAIGFSNHTSPIADTGFMYRALCYAKGIDALILSFPEDRSLAGRSSINEGPVSTLLGMKGAPALAEEIAIARDLALANEVATGIHFSTVSTKAGVELIRIAKQKGIKVSCDVAAHHLVFTEQDLLSFDSLYKVQPPLRSFDDVLALRNGLEDGTIDAIVSQHTPHEQEHKKTEFENAAFGMIGLQTVLPLVLQTKLNIALLIEKLAINPRKIANLPIPQIKAQAPANLTLFDPQKQWVFNTNNNYSKSNNSPLFNKTLTGKVTFICNQHHYRLFE